MLKPGKAEVKRAGSKFFLVKEKMIWLNTVF
jgi:hypothetical protein